MHLVLKLMRAFFFFAKRTVKCNKNEKTNKKERDIESISRAQAKISIDLQKRKRSVVEEILIWFGLVIC